MASIERLLAKYLKLTVDNSKSRVGKPSVRRLLGFRFTGEKACPLTARTLLQKTPPLLLHALGTETLFESQQRLLGEERGEIAVLYAISCGTDQFTVHFWNTLNQTRHSLTGENRPTQAI
jgi:hypothetical protein